MEILFDSDTEANPRPPKLTSYFRVVHREEEPIGFPKPQVFQAFRLVLAFKAYFLPAAGVDRVLSWESHRVARIPGGKERALFLASHNGRSLVVLDLQAALAGPRDLPQSGFVLCSTWDPGFALWVDRLGEVCELSRDRFDRPSERDFWADGEDELGASLIRPSVMLGSRILEHLC